MPKSAKIEEKKCPKVANTLEHFKKTMTEWIPYGKLAADFKNMNVNNIISVWSASETEFNAGERTVTESLRIKLCNDPKTTWGNVYKSEVGDLCYVGKSQQSMASRDADRTNKNKGQHGHAKMLLAIGKNNNFFRQVYFQVVGDLGTPKDVACDICEYLILRFISIAELKHTCRTIFRLSIKSNGKVQRVTLG